MFGLGLGPTLIFCGVVRTEDLNGSTLGLVTITQCIFEFRAKKKVHKHVHRHVHRDVKMCREIGMVNVYRHAILRQGPPEIIGIMM